MQNLFQKVYTHYWHHLDQLPKYEQFHFISRLSLTRNDSIAESCLQSIRIQLKDATDQEVWDLMHQYLLNPNPVIDQKRVEYLQQYNYIRPVAQELFVYFFSRTFWHRDLSAFCDLDAPGIEDQAARLLNDPLALKSLSTFAVNFLILRNYFLNQESSSNLTRMLYKKSSELFPNRKRIDAHELASYIYFITHTIIADSKFYTQPLPVQNMEIYLAIVKEIEEILEGRFNEVHLDAKFEFLVCCLLIGYHSKFKTKIEMEAMHSLSPFGDFLVDTLNSNPQLQRQTLSTSEHRNVLYLIAFYEEMT